MLHTTLVRSILVCVFLAGLYTALPSEVAGTLLPNSDSLGELAECVDRVHQRCAFLPPCVIS